MPNKLDQLGIMNLLGAAANKKSQMASKPAPDDEEDPTNSLTPGAKKAPQGVKNKQAAAVAEKSKGGPKVKMLPKKM